MSKLDMLLERWRSASAERERLNKEVLWLEEEIRKEREPAILLRSDPTLVDRMREKEKEP